MYFEHDTATNWSRFLYPAPLCKKTYIAYTRVSTQKQGSQGVSIQEQQAAIRSYAADRHLHITQWHEEFTSAASSKRPVFKKLVKACKRHPERLGLLIHKIDRGARNLSDWAAIGELIDNGVDVRFVHDDLDLTSRGGRLTADLQAVIAADFIRNLREEVKKGIRGRLTQGLYPFNAPRGYRDCGGGQVKQPHPIIAPLIVAAFKLYATGTYSLQMLSDELAVRGLCTASGNPLPPTAFSKILHNPFYVGQLHVNGKTSPGNHQPLVTQALFDRVQELLQDRRPKKRRRHTFKYWRRLGCRGGLRHLIGEKQKQFTYYRCGRCKGVCVREDRVLDQNAQCSMISAIHSLNEPLLEPWIQFHS